MKKCLLGFAILAACSRAEEAPMPPTVVLPAVVLPEAAPPACPASCVKTIVIDLEAERYKRDYDFKTWKKTAKAVCGWSHWAFVHQVEWCEAKATEFDCGYDSWIDAWPGGRPWSAEGNFKSVGACCFEDPASKFDCAYMKERARVCDELAGETHKTRCYTSFCEDRRKICL